MLTRVATAVSESSTIFSILSKNFLIDDALIDTFDGVSLKLRAGENRADSCVSRRSSPEISRLSSRRSVR